MISQYHFYRGNYLYTKRTYNHIFYRNAFYFYWPSISQVRKTELDLAFKMQLCMILRKHFQKIWSKLFSQTWLTQDRNPPKPLGLRSYKPLGTSPVFPTSHIIFYSYSQQKWLTTRNKKKLLTYLQVMDSSMYD